MNEHETCHQLLASLSEYIDGTLQPELCQQLEEHLNGCDDCRVVVNTLRKTIELYHQSPGPSGMPQDVRERLFHRLDLDDFIQPRAGGTA
jgi:anti-sigma factor RsiW